MESPLKEPSGSYPATRGNWANKTEFLLSCMGYAIGIGNIWRFPYLCYRNGGGAFLVPYLLTLFFCGIPLFFMETALGQFASTGCISLFRIGPLFKGAGYAIVIVNVICTTYYTVILSYPLLFLRHSFYKQLPWANCNNSWNTNYCINPGEEGTINLLIHTNRSTIKTSSDEFFQFVFPVTIKTDMIKQPFSNKILQISESVDDFGSIVWSILFANLISWIVVYLCIQNGVKSVGKVVYFTATFPFLVLFILLLRGITLPGAWNGIFFYIYPQWDKLTNLKVWADAATQIFFSLGPGWGGIVNMASYNNFHNNNKRDSILVPILNCGTSIFAGFAVFSVLGFMSHQMGIPVSSVATGGPGLAFITYPEAISMLPWPNLWAVLFFSMLFFLGLDSVFVQIESIISSVIDEFPHLALKKRIITLLSCCVMFLLSTIFVTNGGMYMLQLFDWYAASIPVIMICFIEVIIVGWTYGNKNFVRDLEFMIEVKIHWWWSCCWKYITPVILLCMFVTSIIFNTTITYHGVEYPNWAIILGWSSCAISIFCIPVYMIYKLVITSKGNLFERIRKEIQPTADWRPADKEIHKKWLILIRGETQKRDVTDSRL